jgi:putative transposase
MSRYRRVNIAGATYFFTINTYRRQQLLKNHEVMESLRAAFKIVRNERFFVIDALVVLPASVGCAVRTRILPGYVSLL